MYPKPEQKPHPPILIGGMAPRVLQRVVEIGDGWLPNRVTPAVIEDSRKQLDALAEERGRDPASISITVYGQPPDRQNAQDFLNAGANRVIVRPELTESEDEAGAELERVAEAVL